MSSVAIGIDVSVVLGDCFAPLGSALELDVIDVDTSVNDVDVNAFATMAIVDILKTRAIVSIARSGVCVG